MRRFELVDGSAAKFWEIAHEGDAFDVRYGRIGTDGRAQRKTFASADEATRAAAKLVAQKEKKGYVEVTAQTGTPKTAEPEETGKSAAAPPRRADRPTGGGEWHTLVAPGRGYEYVGRRLLATTWRGQLGLGRDPSSGALWRVDLGDAAAVEVGRVPRDVTLGALAMDAAGERWAAVERSRKMGARRWWLNGREREANVAALAFAGDLLYAVIDGRVVGLDAQTGEARWETDESLTLIAEGGAWSLATVGDVAFGPQRGCVRWIEPDGASHAQDSALDGQILGVVTSARMAATFYSASDGSWASHVAVWDHETRTERIVALPEASRLRGPGGALTAAGDAVVYPWGELSLETGEVTRYELAPLGTQQPQNLVGAAALSPDERQTWVYWSAGAAVLRVDRETRERVGDASELTQPNVHDLAVAPDGRVALAQDGAVQILDGQGRVLHREEGFECGLGVAFSPDGTRLAYTTGERARVLDAATFEKRAEARMAGASHVTFSPDGERLLIATGKHALLCSAADLSKQNKLSGKDDLRSVRFSGGEILAHDYDGRAYVFEDPGPGEATKKPPAHKPRCTLKRSEADSAVWLAPARVAREGALILVAERGATTAYDEAGKSQWTRPGAAGFTTEGELRVEADRLYRIGEEAPFAALPAPPEHVAASHDARHAVALIHEGLLRWEHTGAALSEAAPSTAAQEPRARPRGFDGATEAFLMVGVTGEMKRADARRLAQRAQTELSGLSVVPEGDCSEETGRDDEERVMVCVGIVAASAEADPNVQGKVTGETNVAEAALADARARWAELEASARALIGDVKLDPEPQLWLIASGPLANASIEAAKGGAVELDGESRASVSAEMEMVPLTLRGPSFTLGVAFD